MGDRTAAVKRAWETRRGEKPPAERRRGGHKGEGEGAVGEWASKRTGARTTGPAPSRALRKAGGAAHPAAEKLAARLADRAPRSIASVGHASLNKVHVADFDGERVILKPRGQYIDPTEAARVHNAAHRLAGALGAGHLMVAASTIPAKGIDGVEDGEAVFAMEHAGEGMKTISRFKPAELEAIGEHDRLAAATIDYLSSNTDRHTANAMFDGQRLVLIDNDQTHGRAPGEAVDMKSIFFKGGKVGYRGSQASVEDLPPRIRQVVTEMTEAEPAEVAAALGISEVEAALVQDRAWSIKLFGLDRALARSGVFTE